MLAVMDPLVGLVLEAWNDFDRVLDGLSAQDAGLQPDGQSSAETKAIVKKAGFLGRWMAASGDPATIFKFFGVKP